jgi:hypothetical protein
MTLWQKTKLYGKIVIGLLFGLGAFLIQHRTQQRDKARNDKITADQARQAEAQRREDERTIARARAEAEDANELARSTRGKDASGLPTGPVGDHRRLRK